MLPKIVIADDHPIVLLGAKIIVQKQGLGEVVGTAASPEDLDNVLKNTPCDLLITDFAMPHSQRDGLTMIGRIRRGYPELKVIVLTSIRNPSLMLSILQLGVSGIVEKNADQRELLSAIEYAIKNKRYVSSYIRLALANASILNPENLEVKLSPKEVEIVRLLASGLTPTQVAQKISRSVKTISWTKISAKKKLGINTDAELYQYARNALLSD
ncbi:response regulator [Pseudomonas kitaguniensis]|uniref:response regulator n=1 Tax=Pseudomonas kitaguniensis TaxID=2607908 RepID=UPI003D01E279